MDINVNKMHNALTNMLVSVLIIAMAPTMQAATEEVTVFNTELILLRTYPRIVMGRNVFEYREMPAICLV